MQLRKLINIAFLCVLCMSCAKSVNEENFAKIIFKVFIHFGFDVQCDIIICESCFLFAFFFPLHVFRSYSIAAFISQAILIVLKTSWSFWLSKDIFKVSSGVLWWMWMSANMTLLAGQARFDSRLQCLHLKNIQSFISR